MTGTYSYRRFTATVDRQLGIRTLHVVLGNHLLPHYRLQFRMSLLLAHLLPQELFFLTHLRISVQECIDTAYPRSGTGYRRRQFPALVDIEKFGDQ